MHPVIVPTFHYVADLYAKEHVLSHIRQRFCIFAGRLAVRRVLSDSFMCKRNNAPPATQRKTDLLNCTLMSDHPRSASLVSICSGRCSRDEAGATSRGMDLFNYLSVRAMHLEMTNGLHTDSFTDHIQRFIRRTGKPRDIWGQDYKRFYEHVSVPNSQYVLRNDVPGNVACSSTLSLRFVLSRICVFLYSLGPWCDNVTNFIDADPELRRLLKAWNSHAIHAFLLQRYTRV